jgi:hypothetical protein
LRGLCSKGYFRGLCIRGYREGSAAKDISKGSATEDIESVLQSPFIYFNSIDTFL